MSPSLSIALWGTGRMGALVGDIATARGHRVVARLGSSSEGGALPKGTDVAIDFSVASAVMPHVVEAARSRCALVLGTTGWDREPGARERVQSIVRESGIGAIVAPNFSFAAHLFRRMVEHAAALAARDDEMDAWIEETHHRMKADHPSGTALALARAVLERLPRKRAIATTLADGPVAHDELLVASARGGYEPGLHRLVLDAPEETITIEHRARSRRAFALGAVRAAEWIHGRSGTFTLDDLLSTGDAT